MNKFDLHMHSNYSSDGEFTPKELIAKAKEAHLSCIALSDHNTPLGIDEMIEEGKIADIQVIPAIEFDTLFEEHEVHVLGYGIDYKKPCFQSLKTTLDKFKVASMKERIKKLNAFYNMDLDAEELLVRFGTKNPFPGIVDTFINDPRYCDKPDFQPYQKGGSRSEPACVNFYWDKCCVGTPCYVRIEYPSLQSCVKQIHDAGGVAIIAHPFRTFYQHEDRLRKVVSYGIDGLEAYSNYHDDAMITYYENYARNNHLILTCGSDFHGAMKPSIQMGEYGYTRSDGGLDIIQNFLQQISK